MPYKSIEDIPITIRRVLPIHAQEIFRESFNNALKQYHDESTAFKVAWSAVKEQYERLGCGRWERKLLI